MKLSGLQEVLSRDQRQILLWGLSLFGVVCQLQFIIVFTLFGSVPLIVFTLVSLLSLHVLLYQKTHLSVISTIVVQVVYLIYLGACMALSAGSYATTWLEKSLFIYMIISDMLFVTSTLAVSGIVLNSLLMNFFQQKSACQTPPLPDSMVVPGQPCPYKPNAETLHGLRAMSPCRVQTCRSLGPYAVERSPSPVAFRNPVDQGPISHEDGEVWDDQEDDSEKCLKELNCLQPHSVHQENLMHDTYYLRSTDYDQLDLARMPLPSDAYLQFSQDIESEYRSLHLQKLDEDILASCIARSDVVLPERTPRAAPDFERRKPPLSPSTNTPFPEPTMAQVDVAQHHPSESIPPVGVDGTSARSRPKPNKVVEWISFLTPNNKLEGQPVTSTTKAGTTTNEFSGHPHAFSRLVSSFIRS